MNNMSGITATQSFTWVIRNVFFDALAADPFFAGYFKRKTKMLATQSHQLPYLGVYIGEEQLAPDGDANAGQVRFMHTARILFSVMVANNDQDIAEQTVDAAFWRICNRLWPDEYIMNLLDTYNPTTGIENPDNTIIEGVVRGTRRHVFGAASLNNETPIVELQFDVSVSYRTMWPPVITDDLLEIDLVTGIKAGDTVDEMNARPQVHATFMLASAGSGIGDARGKGAASGRSI